MKIKSVFLTCESRWSVFNDTLSSLRESDWGDAEVVLDTTALAAATGRDKEATAQQRVVVSQLYIMSQAALDPTWDFLLMMENDLIFNKHLRHNLENWEPLTRGLLSLGSLYCPFAGRKGATGKNWTAYPDKIYGAQALMMSRPFLDHALKVYRTCGIIGLPDTKLPKIAVAFDGRPIYFHTPSLVQHQAVPSMWGGRPHLAANFDPNFRAE